MSKTNWKGFERWIAKALGVERYSKTALGEKAPDVLKQLDVNTTLVIECKNRNSINIDKEMEDSEKYRVTDTDIVVLCYRKTNSKKVDVFLREKDFEKLCCQLMKVVRTQKTYLQIQEMVVRLDWKDFLGMVKLWPVRLSQKKRK